MEMRRKKSRQITGDLLIADFQSAFAAIATAEYAVNEAANSEGAVVSELRSLSDQTYLNPGSISPVRQNDIGRASLNAHVMKVQAAQLQQLSQEQLFTLQSQITADYIGCKVRITATTDGPFDAVWFSDQTGYRTNPLKKTAITGTIAEVNLAQNLLVLKPNLLPRLINREFVAYFAYVIDPATLQPAVKIDLL